MARPRSRQRRRARHQHRRSSRRQNPHLRKLAVLHHLAHPPSPLPLGRSNRIHPHRHPTRSSRTHSGLSQRARLWLSLRALPVLRPARNRAAHPARRVPPAAKSEIRAGSHDSPGRASKPQHRGGSERKAFSGVRADLLQPKTQNPAQQPTSHRHRQKNPRSASSHPAAPRRPRRTIIPCPNSPNYFLNSLGRRTDA